MPVVHVANTLEIHRSFVAEVVKYCNNIGKQIFSSQWNVSFILLWNEVEMRLTIMRFDSFIPSLFVAKYEINPQMQISRNVLGFQCLPQFDDKVLGWLGPWRQRHIVHFRSIVTFAEIYFVLVD